jgi:ubiquitin C-terminal hydrolase
MQRYIADSKIAFEECTRKLDFYRLPKILVLQLKRFSFGKYAKHKINTKVIVEKDLNLSKFLSHSSHSNPSKGYQLTSCDYQLVGIVHHSGDIDFGHYTAECLNPCDGRWYNYNDSHVGEVSMEKFQSNTPYLLFYARNDI